MLNKLSDKDKKNNLHNKPFNYDIYMKNIILDAAIKAEIYRNNKLLIDEINNQLDDVRKKLSKMSDADRYAEIDRNNKLLSDVRKKLNKMPNVYISAKKKADIESQVDKIIKVHIDNKREAKIEAKRIAEIKAEIYRNNKLLIDNVRKKLNKMPDVSKSAQIDNNREAERKVKIIKAQREVERRVKIIKAQREVERRAKIREAEIASMIEAQKNKLVAVEKEVHRYAEIDRNNKLLSDEINNKLDDVRKKLNKMPNVYISAEKKAQTDKIIEAHIDETIEANIEKNNIIVEAEILVEIKAKIKAELKAQIDETIAAKIIKAQIDKIIKAQIDETIAAKIDEMIAAKRIEADLTINNIIVEADRKVKIEAQKNKLVVVEKEVQRYAEIDRNNKLLSDEINNQLDDVRKKLNKMPNVYISAEKKADIDKIIEAQIDETIEAEIDEMIEAQIDEMIEADIEVQRYAEIDRNNKLLMDEIDRNNKLLMDEMIEAEIDRNNKLLMDEINNRLDDEEIGSMIDEDEDSD